MRRTGLTVDVFGFVQLTPRSRSTTAILRRRGQFRPDRARRRHARMLSAGARVGRLSGRLGVGKSPRGRGADSRRGRREPSKRLLLHIGTIKTGTSSIQETLNAAAESGSLNGVAYPVPLEMTHNHLAHVYASPDRLPRIPRHRRRADPESFERIAQTFKHDLFEAIRDNENLILSAEYLSLFSRDDAAALARDLALAGVGEVRVLAYVRDPASLYLSAVQQTLKAGHLFVRPAAFRYRFLEALAVWRAIYPDVRVRPFVRGRLVDGDVVRDFLAEASSFFGDTVAPDDVELRVSNPSLSAEAMVVLQRYRRRYYPDEPNVFKPDSTWLFRHLEQSSADPPQTRPRAPSRDRLHHPAGSRRRPRRPRRDLWGRPPPGWLRPADRGRPRTR